MEGVSDFILCGSGPCPDDSSGYGYDDGFGYGFGGSSGESYGNKSGYGDGSTTSYCFGFGDGSGYDSCDFAKLKLYNSKRVYNIDGIPTLIFSVHGNLAKCKMINIDLTLFDCYVAKNESFFAHGKTAQEAISALREKVIANMDVDEKIAEFGKTFTLGVKYPTRDFYHWHHFLTGSCEYGRQKFAEEHGVDLDGEMTVDEFIKLTEDVYGGDIIKKLANIY